jgi:hypothetical protein
MTTAPFALEAVILPVRDVERSGRCGSDPARGDNASFARFSDPAGNTWVAAGTRLPRARTGRRTIDRVRTEVARVAG